MTQLATRMECGPDPRLDPSLSHSLLSLSTQVYMTIYTHGTQVVWYACSIDWEVGWVHQFGRLSFTHICTWTRIFQCSIYNMEMYVKWINVTLSEDYYSNCLSLIYQCHQMKRRLNESLGRVCKMADVFLLRYQGTSPPATQSSMHTTQTFTLMQSHLTL